MAKMKNHDCPAGLNYVSVKADEPQKTCGWELAIGIMEVMAIAMGLITIGATLATWFLI